MDAPATLREIALKLLEGDTTDTAGKAAELFKTASDIEQQQANTAKLDSERRKVEVELEQNSSHHRFKDLLTAATPLFTTAILAGTLIVQMVQARQAATEKLREDQEKRDEAVRQAASAEQARFTDALKIIQASEKISPAATLLNTFTVEPYRSQARQMAVKLMLRATTVEDFEDIFSATLEPVTLADLPTLVQMFRSMYGIYNPLVAPFTHDPVTNQFSGMTPKQKDLVNVLSAEMAFLSQKIASLILQRAKSDESELDLSGAGISGSSLRNANLRHANISGAGFSSAILDDADMSDIDKFEASYFYFTPWWRAARISPKLLDYLERTWPYNANPGANYPPSATPTPISAADYAENLKRLHAFPAPPGPKN